MKGARKTAWPSAVFAAVALAACLPTAAFGGTARHGTVAKVTVTFTDKKFLVSPGHLEAGMATVVVVNNARKLHVLTIRGPGLKGVRTQRVAAGKSATFSVRLSTGAYEIADSVGLSNVRWLVVSPATVVTSTGNGSVVVPLNDPTRMDCD
jgi:hypothetical protein